MAADAPPSGIISGGQACGVLADVTTPPLGYIACSNWYTPFIFQYGARLLLTRVHVYVWDNAYYWPLVELMCRRNGASCTRPFAADKTSAVPSVEK